MVEGRRTKSGSRHFDLVSSERQILKGELAVAGGGGIKGDRGAGVGGLYDCSSHDCSRRVGYGAVDRASKRLAICASRNQRSCKNKTKPTSHSHVHGRPRWVSRLLG